MREIQRQCVFFFTLKRRSEIFLPIFAKIQLLSDGGEKRVFLIFAMILSALSQARGLARRLSKGVLLL